MRIIVGSTALTFFDLNRREPRDLDIWTDEKDAKGEGKDWFLTSTKILNLIPLAYYDVATPNAIYTMKCSHLGWDIHWQKTKLDILWLKHHGCKVIPELYAALIEVWKKEHGDKSFLSMKKNKKEFFTDEVTYVYDHDYLHELVAHPNKPMYTTCLQEGEDVLISKGKFNNLHYDEKVRMFKEEIAVIAVERWLVNPYWKGKVSWYEAYRLSLKKTITNLTKNWATDFIVKNLEQFVSPDYSYFKHIIQTLNKQENIMNKVDMKVFEELQEAGGGDEGLSYVIFNLCNGDFGEGLVSWDGDYDAYRLKRDNLAKDWGYEHLEQEGGGEGGAESCHGVFALKGKTYMAEYSYASHCGHDYDYIEDTLREVKPVEKTITVYQ